MQVKKFEAPTIQEALDTIKRELGPEAIILQTKKHKRGFGLLSKASVEVTAAVSERSLHKKKAVETRLPDSGKNALNKMPASRQAELLDKYTEKHIERAAATRDRVEIAKARAKPATPAPVSEPAITMSSGRTLTPKRYIDIADEGGPGPRAPQRSYLAPSAPGAGKASLGFNDMSVEEEVRHLKRMIEELKNAQETHGARDVLDTGMGAGAQALMSGTALNNPALQDVFEQLVVSGIDKRFALALVKKAAFEVGQERSANSEAVMDQVAVELMQSTEVSSPLDGIEPGTKRGPAIIALVGPTGVGKTTTVAKIASEALLKRNLKVGLINLDNYKVAAFDQLGTYAKILNVPFRSAGTLEDLRAAIQDFQGLDLVLIDTTGRSQRDPNSLKEMQAILGSIPEVRSQLVLSVTTRDTELYDMATRFSVFRPQGITVSKLDEATIYGALYNVSQRVKLPLLYFTTGQRVPEDIEEATKERVAALILNI